MSNWAKFHANFLSRYRLNWFPWREWTVGDALFCVEEREENIDVEEREENIDVQERGKERERGIKPAAAVPSQPDCPGVGRSDHSVGSKELASWRALELRSDWHGRLGAGGERKKVRKEAAEAARTDRRRTKKRMAVDWTARRDKYRRWRKRSRYRRRRKRERARARAGIERTAAAPSQPDCPGLVGRREERRERNKRKRQSRRTGAGQRENGSWTNSANG